MWCLAFRLTEKNTKGGFLPILGAIAKPLLLSAVTEIGGYASKKKLEKNFCAVKEEE